MDTTQVVCGECALLLIMMMIEVEHRRYDVERKLDAVAVQCCGNCQALLLPLLQLTSLTP
jgi:hypothetical protein